jgi:hypothetical protein
MLQMKSIAPIGNQCGTALRRSRAAASLDVVDLAYNLAAARTRGRSDRVAECGA